VPLYECPTNTNQDIDGIKNLTPVHDGISWVYIRISSPDEPDFDRNQILYPENTHVIFPPHFSSSLIDGLYHSSNPFEKL